MRWEIQRACACGCWQHVSQTNKHRLDLKWGGWEEKKRRLLAHPRRRAHSPAQRPKHLRHQLCFCLYSICWVVWPITMCVCGRAMGAVSNHLNHPPPSSQLTGQQPVSVAPPQVEPLADAERRGEGRRQSGFVVVGTVCRGICFIYVGTVLIIDRSIDRGYKHEPS